jgi:amidohydrolase
MPDTMNHTPFDHKPFDHTPLDCSSPDHRLVVKQSLSQHLRQIVDLSHRIHAHPEPAFEEAQACEWTAHLLAEHGFEVSRGICELPTAFAADIGPGPLTIVLCAEYDALPGIGHACGHNIIAASSVGAALALAPIVTDLGMKIRVLGTPAEEVGNAGGKILLLEGGAFLSAHAALMVHPAPLDSIDAEYCAAATYTVEYRASRSSSSPGASISAGDALTVAQVAIGLLREHIRPHERIHGVVTHGGVAPNVVPESTSASYIVRARYLCDVQRLSARVMACFEAGATATGCSLRVTGGDKPYAEMRPDREMLALYKKNAERLGRKFTDRGRLRSAGASTDMGNVSQTIPSIHPCIGIGSYPVVNHQPEFAACCISDRADRAVRDGALALAWTIVDMASRPMTRDRLLAATGAATGAVTGGTAGTAKRA